MFARKAPDPDRMRTLLNEWQAIPFPYAGVGATQEDLTRAPDGFRLDTYQTPLGRGRATFDRAVQALRELANYPPSFTRVVKPRAIAPGEVFATIASHPGFVSIHPCRIIYVLQEEEEEGRFGFGFGTLPGHAVCGEERFRVTLDPSDQTVRYSVQAFSRPGSIWLMLGAPFVRAYQRRFRRETQRAMQRLSDPRSAPESEIA